MAPATADEGGNSLAPSAQVLEDPPTHPETFASRVMGVPDGSSDPDAFIDVLRPVLKTFLGVLRASG
jgi:hypothetical protein